ncbi:hypothetical protein HG530_001915 [Fusarium avenaceum]|nr:hypothetical protein HG530_001915 [Fusarium avenaceum]
MSQNYRYPPREGPLGVRMAPEAEVPITMVYSQSQGDIHIFLPETTTMELINHAADNFSHRVQQPVKVFHDEQRKKYRLCPFPDDIAPNTSTWGRYCFTRDRSTLVRVSAEDPTVGENEQRIPPIRTVWNIYRQAKLPEIVRENPELTTNELSSILGRSWITEPPEVRDFWQKLAEKEERNHERLYPGYDQPLPEEVDEE